MASSYDFLKKVPLFSGLSEEDLNSLCGMIEEIKLPSGEMLFEEGDSGDHAYVIKEGDLEIIKFSDGKDVLLAVRHSGEVIGEMSLLQEAPRMAGARASSDVVLYAISHIQLDQLINASSSAARAILHTVTARLNSTEIMLRQSEKMAQLGTLTAGVAHELNNPAAAVRRGADQLDSIAESLKKAQLELAGLDISADQLSGLTRLAAIASDAGRSSSIMDPLDKSDLEFEVEEWLEERNIDNAWELAPALAGPAWIEIVPLVEPFSGKALSAVLRWFSAISQSDSLLAEIGQGARRISEIVKALKSYSYLDQAPIQSVNVQEGLEDTLLILRGKLKDGITIRRKFDVSLPEIQAYGSELNQVWTNIIDNAVDAMDGKGELHLATEHDSNSVTIRIQDSGPGIPTKALDKIFDPFFTTKPPGKGTGLGLNISYNIIAHKHKGTVNVFSEPGKTEFVVVLPKDLEKGLLDGDRKMEQQESWDDKMRRILTTYNTVAVVGASNKVDRPAHFVPAYLAENGYKIFAVNPIYKTFLGEPAYPTLAEVPVPIEIVNVFRRADAIPQIAREAVAVGAKVLWMQEGLVSEEAKKIAEEAGLEVVMDACMRVQHIRLVSTKE